MNTIVIPAVLANGLAACADYAWRRDWRCADRRSLCLRSAGLWLVVHSIRLFVRLGSGTLAPWDPTQALVTDGAYRYSRNPMKGGLFLILAGEAL